MTVNHSTRFGFDGTLVPEAGRGRIQESVDGGARRAGRPLDGTDPLGLIDCALPRLAVAGPPGDGIARVEDVPAARAHQPPRPGPRRRQPPLEPLGEDITPRVARWRAARTED